MQTRNFLIVIKLINVKGRMLLPGGYLEGKCNVRPFRGQIFLNPRRVGTLYVSAGRKS